MRYFLVETNTTFRVEAASEEEARHQLEGGSFQMDDVSTIVVLNVIETDEDGDEILPNEDGEEE